MKQNDYINLVAPLIRAENQKRGNPLFSSVVIAQSILETGWGRSNIMLKANAIFGIKAFDDWKGKIYSAYTNEVYNNNSITIQAKFRAYDRLEDSIKDYFDLICKSSRYRKALVSNSPYECITAIKEGGYATDPNYVHKIMKLIETNDLTRFDKQIQNNDIMYTVGNNYITQVNLNVRDGAGTDKRIKDYSELTEDGKKHAFEQQKAVLKKGTTVTVLSVLIDANGNIWLKIPSGFIAGYYGGGYYVR